MKSLTGIVTSTPDPKTAYVLVSRMLVHPKYKKRLKRTKVFVAENTKGATVDQEVVLVETRPLSKRKCWRVEEVVNK